MIKKFLSMLIVVTIILNTTVVMTVSGSVTGLDLRKQNINDERLSEMIENGEIPQNLIWLNLGGNQISDLTPLEKLVSLEDLELGSNHISDLTPLSKLSNLESLGLYYNQITDITPLANLTNLGGPFGGVDLGNNQITDISPLSNLTKLQWLQLDNNQITDLTPMYSLTNLLFYTIDGNPVTDEQVHALREQLSKAKFFYGFLLGGDVSIADALEMLKHLAGIDSIIKPGNAAWFTAMITEQSQEAGRVGIGDVLEVLKKLAGIESRLD